MAAPDLDAWLRDPGIRSRHRRTAASDPDTLWRAAEGVRLRDTRRLGRLVGWRIPGVAGETAFRDLFRGYPFIVLDEGEHWSISGLVGRIWTLDRDYPRLAGPEAFRAWDRRGTARVLFAHWVEPLPDGRSLLLSEARVAATSRAAALRLRALWAVVGPFERLIGGEALALAAQRAERSA